jgi:DNA polymerase elongation subunit (family B)
MNYKEILFGKPTDKPIVAIDTVKGNVNQLAVYRKVNGKTQREIRKNTYYVYTDMENATLALAQCDIPMEVCTGPNVLNVLFHPRDYNEFKWLRSFLPESRCQSVSGAQAHLIEVGENMFSGMAFDDVSRLSFDLETYSSGHFPDAKKPEDAIIMIAVSGREDKLFRLDEYPDEGVMIRDFLDYIRAEDPDILVNQNIFRFDLPYLQDRCALWDIPLQLGRDGSEPYTFPTKMKFAEKEVEYPNYVIHGRHVLDTWFMIMDFDVVARELEAHDLKTAAKHFGIAADDRVYIEGDKIKHYWDDPILREDLAKYAIFDTQEALGIDRVLGQSAFYATQFIPLQHQDVFRYGTGTRIDSIFTRAYIRNREAYPIPNESEDYGGGFNYLDMVGYFEGAYTYADVKSLYPMMRKILDIKPPNDTLDIYGPIMDLMTEERFKSKDLADEYKAKDDHRFESEDAKQNSFKRYINTGNYGFLAFEYTGFNYYPGAAAITENGQLVLKKMIELSNDAGYYVIRGDTDGLLVNTNSWDNLDNYYDFINKEIQKFGDEYYGEGKGKYLKITNDGEYEKGLVFDGKSYILVDRKGKIKVKGNTLKSRAMEPFVKDTLREIAMAILDKDYDSMLLYYNVAETLLNSRKLTFKEIAKRSTLKMGRDEYRHKTTAGNTNKAAAYEIAYGQEHDIPYRKGDPVRYYVKESGYKFTWFKNGNWQLSKNKAKVSEQARLEKDFNGDYDIEHYTNRLHRGVIRLLPIFGVDEFSSYFPNIKITTDDIKKLKKHGISSDEDDFE